MGRATSGPPLRRLSERARASAASLASPESNPACGASSSPAASPFRLLVSQMELDSFVGKLVIGRVFSGEVRVGDPVVHLTREGKVLESGKVLKLFARRGASRAAALPLLRAARAYSSVFNHASSPGLQPAAVFTR